MSSCFQLHDSVSFSLICRIVSIGIAPRNDHCVIPYGRWRSVAVTLSHRVPLQTLWSDMMSGPVRWTISITSQSDVSSRTRDYITSYRMWRHQVVPGGGRR